MQSYLLKRIHISCTVEDLYSCATEGVLGWHDIQQGLIGPHQGELNFVIVSGLQEAFLQSSAEIWPIS